MSAAYFTSGVRPMEIIVHFALREQILTFKLHNYFRMTDLLLTDKGICTMLLTRIGIKCIILSAVTVIVVYQQALALARVFLFGSIGRMKKYRNEWKYCCTERELLDVEARAKGILQIDSHAGADGTYMVHSLYFDNRSYSCAHATEMGLGRRYKYRIRYYGNSPKTLRLERKEKENGRCRKLTCLLTTKQYESIMTGQIEEVFWNTDNKVLKQFCIDIWKKGFEPKVIVDYERIAYVEEISNIRITFDKNITASGDVEHFLDGDYAASALLEKGKHILEVKFDEILPGYIKKVIYVDTLQQTSFSKYYIGLKKLVSKYGGIHLHI